MLKKENNIQRYVLTFKKIEKESSEDGEVN